MSDLIVLELRCERIPTWNEVYNALNEVPTVDAVPVVRCKDCISWAGGHCVPFDINTKPDDFCSKAYPFKEGRQ